MDALSTLLANIARTESGGQPDPYQAEGPATSSGDHAFGKYQVMGANIPQWSQQVLGRTENPFQFLHDPAAQEAIARSKIGFNLARYGNPQDAASIWFTGKPLAQGANLRDVNGMSGARYAALAAAGVGPPTRENAAGVGPPTRENAAGLPPSLAGVAPPANAAASPPPAGGASPSQAPAGPDWGAIFSQVAQAAQPRPPAMGIPTSQAPLARSSQYQTPLDLTAGTAPNLVLTG